MITAEFIITTSYSVVSVIMYGFVAYLIIRNKKIFFGSYFHIILVDSAVNVFTYISTLINMRLPKITCKDCLLAPLMSKMPGMNFFGCMFNHMAYVQYLMVFSLIFNRFTAVLLPLKYNTIWKHLFFPLMLFNLLAPFAITYPWFTITVSLSYLDGEDRFILTKGGAMNPNQTLALFVSMIVLTIVCTVLTVTTFIVYGYKARKTDNLVEMRLLIYSVIYFLIQVFAALDIAIQLGKIWQIQSLVTIGTTLLPYVSDALTFSSPYILLFCSSSLRGLLKKMLQKNPCKQNKITAVVVISTQ